MTGGPDDVRSGLDALARRGLWDPHDPGSDTERRRDLLEFLLSRGAPVERIVHAATVGDTQGLGFDLLVETGTLDARGLADAVGMELPELLLTYRHLGVEITDPTEARFSEEEVDFISTLRRVLAGFPDDAADEVLQALAAAVSSLAAACIGAFVGSVESQLAEEQDELAWAGAITEAGEGALDVAGGLRDLFRHHLRSAIDQQRRSMRGVDTRQLSIMAVGFVDLVGFTSTTSHMTPEELVAFVNEFRHGAHDTVTAGGGRLVKHIGDEVMFSAVDPSVACGIGRSLIDRYTDGEAGPRGGVAHGQLVARHGDLYGPVVNLASRLAGIAVPGELLAPADIAGTELAGVVAVGAGRRQLKGFDAPVEVVSIEWPAAV